MNKFAGTSSKKKPKKGRKKESGSGFDLVKDILFHIPPEIDNFGFYFRLAIYAVMIFWGLKFIFSPMAGNYAGRSILHLVNLPFHEAGHIFFGFFGEFIRSLGGSLGQLLMPLICLFTLLLKTRDTFGSAVCLWWFGENFLDIAPYMNDANKLTMPLLGGNTGSSAPYGFHDWEYILTESGLIKHTDILANGTFGLGVIIMMLSFVWGGYLLIKQYQFK
ncbi:MAG: zinc ribbon domain-containing protein [Deltaproteobacteria bacterium]|nr:zinc ribbon domain-containing protein [Deltaproteobacteria bacterium]